MRLAKISAVLAPMLWSATGAAIASSPPPIQWVDGSLDVASELSKHFGIRNNTDHVLATVIVECGFFNASGNLVATGSDFVLKVAPGDTAYDAVTAPNPGLTAGTAKCRWYQTQ